MKTLKNETKREGLIERYFRKLNEKRLEKQLRTGAKGKNWIQKILGW